MTWIGRRVQTPDGQGKVTDLDPVHDVPWVNGKPPIKEWEAVVQLDGDTERRYLTTALNLIPEEVANE